MSPRRHSRESLRPSRVRYVAGESKQVLAAELGVAPTTLRNLWTRYDLTDELPVVNRLRLSMDEKREIHRRWNRDETLKHICAEKGLPYTDVHKALLSAGLTLDRKNNVQVRHYKSKVDRRRMALFCSTAMGLRAEEPPVPWAEIQRRLSRRGYPYGWRVLANAVQRYRERIAKSGRGS